MHIRVISLNTPAHLLATLKRLFPEAEVDVQRGVDLRKVDVSHLHEANLITHGAAHVLRNGRKWHHELSSKGAIGLAHANRIALLDRPEEPLLLMEDDAVIKDEGAFVRAIHMLLGRQDLFDVAAFGVVNVNASDTQARGGLPPDWVGVHGMFHCTHAVLYTPSARRTIGEYFRDYPLEMQIDSLLGSLAKQGVIRIVASSSRIVEQSAHVSSIQEFWGVAILCHIQPPGPYASAVVAVVAVMVLAVVAFVLNTARTRLQCRA